MSIYDTARQLKISGVVVQAHIDPTQITPRIKKMTQAMFRTGKLKGGWASKSMQLARQLMRDQNLPVLNGWDAMFRCQPLTDADLAQFDEWFEADAALEKMKIDGGTNHWAIKRLDSNVADNKRVIRKLSDKQMVQFYLRFDNQELKEAAHEKLLAMRLPEDVAELNALADRLDDPTPIPMKLEIF
jgi:hypothetical protein